MELEKIILSTQTQKDKDGIGTKKALESACEWRSNWKKPKMSPGNHTKGIAQETLLNDYIDLLRFELSVNTDKLMNRDSRLEMSTNRKRIGCFSTCGSTSDANGLVRDVLQLTPRFPHFLHFHSGSQKMRSFDANYAIG
ncbi:hypothetical protein STEG23_036409, partial [Scotinomys teguina]